MRSLRLCNETEKPLRVHIEPCSAHTEIAPDDVVEASGFDPAEEVLDATVQIGPDGATVTFRSANQIGFAVIEPLRPPRPMTWWERISAYWRPQTLASGPVEKSRTTRLRIENKTDAVLGFFVEPYPDYYQLPAGKVAELCGFDPRRDDVWDFYLNVRPDEACVLLGPFGKLSAFVEGKPLVNWPS